MWQSGIASNMMEDIKWIHKRDKIVKNIGKEEKNNTYEINKQKTNRNMAHLIQTYL